MAPLTSKTAGKPKALYMKGMYPNGKAVKPAKMESLYEDLMDYANRLEASEPAHARTLKAELHKRATQLSLEAVQNNAEMVLNGTNQSREDSLELVEQLQNVLTHAKKHAKTTAATHKNAGALQASVADAQANSSAAGEQSISAASSSNVALGQKDTIIRQHVEDVKEVQLRNDLHLQQSDSKMTEHDKRIEDLQQVKQEREDHTKLKQKYMEVQKKYKQAAADRDTWHEVAQSSQGATDPLEGMMGDQLVNTLTEQREEICALEAKVACLESAKQDTQLNNEMLNRMYRKSQEQISVYIEQEREAKKFKKAEKDNV